MAEYYLDLATMVSALQSLGQTGQIETDLLAPSQKGRGSVQLGRLTLIIKNGRVVSWVLLDANGGQVLAGNENDIGTLHKRYPMRMKWKFTQTVLPTSSMPGPVSQFSSARDLSDASHSEETPSMSMELSHPGFLSDSSHRRTSVPRRVGVMSAEYLASMPRQYRMIYALVNGMNSIERIIQLMTALPPDTIEMILHELQSHNIITM